MLELTSEGGQDGLYVRLSFGHCVDNQVNRVKKALVSSHNINNRRLMRVSSSDEHDDESSEHNKAESARILLRMQTGDVSRVV